MDFDDYHIDHDLLERFEQMLKSSTKAFFDHHEFEALIEHYAEHGNLKNALLSARLGTEYYPNSITFPLRRAQILAAHNRTDEALSELKRVENISPDNSELLIARASIFSRLGKHDQAINFYRQAIKKDEELREEIMPYLGFEYKSLFQWEKAIECYKEVLKFDPDDEIAMFNISDCFERAEKREEAIALFNELVDASPFNEIAWYQLSVAFRNSDQLDKALWALDYSLLIDEEFYTAIFEKASIYEEMERYGEAILYYKNLIEQDYQIPALYVRISSCYYELKDLKNCLLYSTKATHEDTEQHEAWQLRGLALWESGKWNEGLVYLRKSVKLNSGDPDYHFILGEKLMEIEFFQEAVYHFKKVMELMEAEEEEWVAYTKALFMAEEYIDALATSNMAVAVIADNANLHMMRAAMHLLVGDKQIGIDSFKFALDLSPDSIRFIRENFPDLIDWEGLSDLENEFGEDKL
jgi:tetratricopeptide (TPR) repeat protein